MRIAYDPTGIALGQVCEALEAEAGTVLILTRDGYRSVPANSVIIRTLP